MSPYLSGLPVQDVGELLHEALEAVGEAVDVVREAVVGDHRRDRGEQADRGGDQRLGDAGRDLRERRLLHVRQAAERVHDAPHGAEQADVRAHRAGRGEEREVALERSPSRAGRWRASRGARRRPCRRRRRRRWPAQLGELAEARLEDALQAADGVAVVDRALVERVQVVAAPELALELVGLRAARGGSRTTSGR